jgi:hypothetical protein
MGTRSLTFVYDDNDKPIVCMYRQFDGYPTGHGQELAEFLMPLKVGNGISGEVEMGTFANGMGCLAAQMIVEFKKDVGGIYLYPTDTTDAWQDYEYHVYEDKVVIKNPNVAFFEGDYNEFMEFCLNPVEVE